MENGPVEIVDFPIKNGDFPWQNVSLPEGIHIGFLHVKKHRVSTGRDHPWIPCTRLRVPRTWAISCHFLQSPQPGILPWSFFKWQVQTKEMNHVTFWSILNLWKFMNILPFVTFPKHPEPLFSGSSRSEAVFRDLTAAQAYWEAHRTPPETRWRKTRSPTRSIATSNIQQPYLCSNMFQCRFYGHSRITHLHRQGKIGIEKLPLSHKSHRIQAPAVSAALRWPPGDSRYPPHLRKLQLWSLPWPLQNRSIGSS